MAPSEFDLTDKTALVTGAGVGIGRAIAKSYAAAGATVWVADIASDRAEQTVDAIRASGATAHAIVGDVSSEPGVANLVSGIGNDIDILCNNVGIIDDFTLPHEMSLEMWDRVLRLNLTSQFLLCRATLPAMLGRGSGVIINLASEAGLRGGAAGLAYTASKHGVVGLTRNIAYTYAQNGVRCNAICPGGVAGTSISRGVTINRKAQAQISKVRETIGDLYATPKEMASVAVFLASDASSFVNGAIIPVDGGWLAG